MSSELKQEMSSLSIDSQDRPHRFIFEYMNTSPIEHHRTLRRFYLFTSAISAVSTAMILFASVYTFKLNTSQSVEIVRVDGAIVEEFKDERRLVLINNTKNRFSLLQSGVKENPGIKPGVEDAQTLKGSGGQDRPEPPSDARKNKVENGGGRE